MVIGYGEGYWRREYGGADGNEDNSKAEVCQAKQMLHGRTPRCFLVTRVSTESLLLESVFVEVVVL